MPLYIKHILSWLGAGKLFLAELRLQRGLALEPPSACQNIAISVAASPLRLPLMGPEPLNQSVLAL